MEKIKGKSFFFGENIDTDQILPGYAMSAPPEELGQFALKGSNRQDFAEEVSDGDLIIAEDNFGCGSSREQAPLALKQTGLGAIIASSYARIFRKNAINIGLPVVICQDIARIKQESQDGDIFELDIEKALLKNVSTSKEYPIEPLSQATYDTLAAGGLIEKVRNILKSRGEDIE